MGAVGHVLILIGSLLILLAAIGVVQFPDVLSRMHALSKASTGGVAAVMIGAVIVIGELNAGMSLVFAALLQVATNPVSSTLLTQATYYAEGIAVRTDMVDDLAAALDQRERAERRDDSDDRSPGAH